jgi:hypothetical protein
MRLSNLHTLLCWRLPPFIENWFGGRKRAPKPPGPIGENPYQLTTLLQVKPKGKMSPEEVAVWLDRVSKALADQKRPRPPANFIYDLPVPPRYAKWTRSGR